MLAKLRRKVKHLYLAARSSGTAFRRRLLPIIRKAGSLGEILRPSYWKFFLSFLAILLPVVTFYFAELDRKRNGVAEVISYLGPISASKKLMVWSNNPELCRNIELVCRFGNNFRDFTEFDYFVFFENQAEGAILDDGPFADLRNSPGTTVRVKRLTETITKAKIVSRLDVLDRYSPVPAEFTFAIIGDSQRWSQAHHQENRRFHDILKLIQKFDPKFLLAMGDLTPDYDCLDSHGCRPYFERWRDEVRNYVPAVYPAFGNHDESNLARSFWSDVFSLPQNGPKEVGGTAFSFDFMNAHFVFLDSEKTGQQSQDSEQLQWLGKDLRSTDRRNLFVISHAPNFPKPKLKQLGQWKLLFRNNVFAQFSGDTHVFCRRTLKASELETAGGTLNHFIIGNSGSMVHPLPPGCEDSYRGLHFAIVRIKGSEMVLTAYKDNGDIISEIKLVNEGYFSL